ncbi:hypothetical protein P154DRAFT_526576 [Amniculicola lignicola CBS 123094]|uniref:Uncharacterized protein n=1 Tax=Amniculicola lignicola CBS 123094 TaxID=1392246 RepID=A0A6A5W2D5_9PLEO|nr:hypothetical protein P154DRAFT_526576 [Amniculicola lignicola CBS 123094]
MHVVSPRGSLSGRERTDGYLGLAMRSASRSRLARHTGSARGEENVASRQPMEIVSWGLIQGGKSFCECSTAWGRKRSRRNEIHWWAGLVVSVIGHQQAPPCPRWKMYGRGK